MNHPSSLLLEAYACGEASDVVTAHLETCEACRAFVNRLHAFSEEAPTVHALDALKARHEASGARPALSSSFPLRKFWIGASTAILPLAAAAALLLFLRRPDASSIEEHVPRVASSHAASTTIATTSDMPENAPDPSPETRFKGGVHVAVVRERGAEQERFASTTFVHSGDRLRIEVALDHEQVIVAGVFGDDGSYLELMPASVRGAGTHFSEHSVRIDAHPTRGTIAVGSPEAMAKARATQDFGDLTTLRLDVEGLP